MIAMTTAIIFLLLLSVLTRHACEGARHIPQPATDRLITQYFFEWKTYPSIVSLLALGHNIRVSLSWLKCRLKFLRLSRRRWYSRRDLIGQAMSCILEELKTANASLSYRTMWNLLRDKHLVFVPRRIVQMILAVFDPSRSNQRRKRCLKRRIYINKGPNYAWHLDGNDKMGPTYGFFIHGCIDGFSRKILWLHLTPTNHKPEVIVHFYAECVRNLGGCPRLIRSDYGTENCILAASQMALRHGHPDPFSGVRSFQYGKSTANTRIESWWAMLKRFRLAWWLEKLDELVDEGLYDSENITHRHCLGYCYADLISESLAEFVTLWNGHYIRKTKGARCPGGIPDVLYKYPETAGTRDFFCNVNHTVVNFITLNHCQETPPFYPPEFKAAADAFLQWDFHMSQSEITVHNVKYVFAYLVDVTSIQ